MGYRIILFTTIVFGCLLSLTMRIPADNEKPMTPENDTGLSKDLRLLRKTMASTNKPPVRISSSDAVEAAKRVFGRLQLVGMSKDHVLWILGDPKTISDRAVPQEPGKDSPLIYRFDLGAKGYDGTVRFKNGRVTSVGFGLWAY